MMGLLSKIFGSKKDVSNVDIDNKAKSSVKNVPRNENCIKLMEFASHMEKLLAEDRYIARSDYKKYIDEYQKSISFFEVLSDSGMLGNFCDVNGVEEKEIVQAIDYYNNAETYVEDHNEEFLARAMVEEKEYLDNVLKAVDPVVVLDAMIFNLISNKVETGDVVNSFSEGDIVLYGQNKKSRYFFGGFVDGSEIRAEIGKKYIKLGICCAVLLERNEAV